MSNLNLFERKMRSEFGGIEGIVDICDHVSKTNTVVNALEVGSYKGESTIAFAKHFKHLKNFIAVDPYSFDHNSDLLFTEENIKYVETYFLNAIKEYPVIKHLKKSSIEAAKDFDDKKFDFIYIDGCHLTESVIADAKAWIPKVKKGGHIAFHDINSTNVQTALSNFFDLKEGFITRDNSVTFGV